MEIPTDPRHKVLVFGEFGAGKSTFALSVIEYLRDVRKQKPEDTKLVIIDNDGGMDELFAEGAIPDEWFRPIDYHICHDWETMVKATDEALPMLEKWQKEHGRFSAWFIVDNVGSAWEWARDDYSLRAYGMLEHELAEAKRQEAVAAGKKFIPTFKGGSDWNVITPKHAQWADRIKKSPVNFIWCAPESVWSQKDEETEETITTIKPKGQGANRGRVSHVVRLHMEDDGVQVKYLLDLKKNRGGERLVKNMPNPTYKRIWKWIEANSRRALAKKAAEEEAAKKAEEAQQPPQQVPS